MSNSSQPTFHLPIVRAGQHPVAMLATPEEIGLSPRAVHAARAAGIKLIGQLVQTPEYRLFLLPGVGRRTIHDIKNSLGRYGLQLGIEIPGWDTAAALEERRRLGASIRRHLAKMVAQPAPELKHLEDELHTVLGAAASGRNLSLLSSLWGFDGTSPKTLDAVGRSFGLTRERVRQLGSKARKQFECAWHEAPLLETAVGVVENSVPATKADLSQRLLEEGITTRSFDADSLLIAAELLGRTCKIVGHRIGDVTLYVPSDRARWLHRVPSEFRKATQANGCASVERLTLRVGGRLEEAPGVRRMLDALYETIWLDEARSWAMSTTPARNRLSNLIKKVLTVAKAVQISELRSAVSRPHRMSYTPPRNILAEFCRRTQVGLVVDDFVVRPEQFRPLELGWAEQILVEAFTGLGSPLERDQLEEFCIEQRGMNIHTFGVFLSYSPLVQRLALAIYSLVGAPCQIGAIEDIQTRRTQTPAPASNYGWTSDGRLWCGIRLDRLAIKTGKRNLPVFVADLTQGEWVGMFEDGTAIGNLVVSEQAINGLASTFSMSGAENDDVARLTFGLADRRTSIEVGGDELLEAPGGTFTDGADDFEADIDLDC